MCADKIKMPAPTPTPNSLSAIPRHLNFGRLACSKLPPTAGAENLSKCPPLSVQMLLLEENYQFCQLSGNKGDVLEVLSFIIIELLT